MGIDELKQSADSDELLVIIFDHSNQVESKNVMPALGVNTAAMPEPGQALTHEEVRVLDVSR